MAKGKSTWKYNKLLTARRNYYLGGGYMNSINRGVAYNNPGIAPEIAGVGGTTNTTQPDLGNTKIDQGQGGSTGGTGLFSSIGSIGMQGASDIAGMINNIQSNDITQKADSLISGVNSRQMRTQSKGDTFDALSQDWANNYDIKHVTAKQMGAANFGQGFGQAFVAGNKGFAAGAGLGAIGAAASAVGSTITSIIGTAGRNRKAKREAARVNAAIDYTNDFNKRSLTNRASNLVSSQIAGLEANYSALGGPLNFGGDMGAIEYELANRYLDAKEASANRQSSSVALPNYGLKLPTFAFGGELNTQGGDFTNGLLYIDNGGSHETNPFEGVPMGVDQEGTPNLVEEGETVFNDYVFSKRLKVPKAVRDKYKMRGTKDLTFAEMSKQIAKESEERPNDPISMRGLEALMSDLATAQESVRPKKQGNTKFDTGGRKRSVYKGVSGYNDNWIDANGNYIPSYIKMVNDRDTAGWNNHFNSQYEYYMNPENKGSLRWQAIDNFYYANPDFKVPNIELTADEVEWARNGAKTGPVGFMHTWGDDNISPKTPIERHMLRSLDGDPTTMPESDIYYSGTKGGYDWATRFKGKYTRANNGAYEDTTDDDGNIVRTYYYDPIEQRKSGNRYYKKGTNGQYELVEGDNPHLAIQNAGNYTPVRSMANDQNGTDYYYDPDEADTEYKKLHTGLRYAPAVGLGLAAISDALGLTNKPDYSNAEAILEASRGAGTYQPVRFNPIGNYLTYRPFDRDYYINKMNAEAGASRRAIMNTSGGNRATAMAGILAADNNYLNQIGGLARQAEEYNLAQRAQVEEFNRGTNTTNSQGFLQADMANQKALMDARETTLKGTMAAAEMRERARLASEQAKSANLSGFVTALGDIGRENMAWNWRNFGMSTGTFGNIGDEEKLLTHTGKRKTNSGAKGGKIRRKKGLTI